jgi:hypothetical protein
VTEVQFGGKSDRALLGDDGAVVYANKRAEMWGNMRQWLRNGAIDNDPELLADLTGVEYGYVLRDGRDAIQLERKEDMKRRGLASSDDGDALALTFAYPVTATDRIGSAGRLHRFEYDPFAHAWEQLDGRSGRRMEHAEVIAQMQACDGCKGCPESVSTRLSQRAELPTPSRARTSVPRVPRALVP